MSDSVVTQNELLERYDKGERNFSGQTIKFSKPIVGKVLRDINLSDATIVNATFVETDLSYANLTNARFLNGSFQRVNLSYAKLAGANLADTKLDSVDLEGATYDSSSTQFPSGFTPETFGAMPLQVFESAPNQPEILVNPPESSTSAPITASRRQSAQGSNYAIALAIFFGLITGAGIISFALRTNNQSPSSVATASTDSPTTINEPSRDATISAQKEVPTDPSKLPFLELKPATQQQKELLGRIPNSGYSQIPRQFIRIAEIDLNNDGTEELIATYNSPSPGYCGNRGCPLSIYTNSQGRWTTIYEVLGASPIRVSSTTTNGFRDLLITFSSIAGVQRVLTFNGEYTHTHFQEGNDRFRAFNDDQKRRFNFPASTVFYTRPSLDSPRAQLPLLDQNVIIARTNNNWFLVTCVPFACAGSYFYVPVEVVDGRRSSNDSISTPSPSDRSRTQVSYANNLSDPTCKAVVADIRQDMTRRLGLRLRYEDSKPVENERNPFPDRKVALGFGFSYDTALSNFFSSIQLRATYAKRITDACASVAIVRFGDYQSDISASVYRMPDGSVREAVYVDIPDRRSPQPPLPWGHEAHP